MIEDYISFRQFCNDLQEKGTAQVLEEWVEAARTLLAPLRKYGEWEAHARTYWQGNGEVVDRKMLEDLWELYAFSRASDLLLLPFQEGNFDGSDWRGPVISYDVRFPDPEDEEELTVDERVELLVNRCFVRTGKTHDDLYPYKERLRSWE